ncbi:hypothetical protein C2845_PM05G03400 [Panicum miliaceum]|uniref:Uncharacterized protein n=1 Tax=Panicum miliaceum TaxID=4540 RepID=A0A3L6T0Q4_PANMI|nr:hypothetical protein C2845_PM05G03400 [Panicum miliaceum]
MNQITAASDINKEIQHGLNIGASMNWMTTASDINEEIYSAQTTTVDGMQYTGHHENAILDADQACHLGPNVGDYMDHMSAIASNPHEGIINGTMVPDLTSNFLEDVSIISANKDLYKMIDFIDDNSSAALANHVKHAALILKDWGAYFGAAAVNPSQGPTGDLTTCRS